MQQDNTTYHLYVTHTEGFDPYIIQELCEKCGDFFSQESITHQYGGIVAFKIHVKDLTELEKCVFRLCQLGCIDDVFYMIDILQEIPYEKEEMMQLCDEHVNKNEENWTHAFDVFEHLYKGKLEELVANKKNNDYDVAASPEVDSSSARRWWFHAITFRASAERFRKMSQHKYKSPDVSAEYGWALMEKYKWKVSLKQFDLNVSMHLKLKTMVVGLQLSPSEHELFSYKSGAIDKESYLHLVSLSPIYKHAKLDFRRAFGRSAMKPTTAYNLLRTARLQEKENIVLLDPMGGSGTIALQAAYHFGNNCTHGYIMELDRNDVQRARQNVDGLQEFIREELKATDDSTSNAKRRRIFHQPVSIDCLHNDSRWLPLRTDSVDMVVCDMPFGSRCGSHGFNAKCYPKVVKELERVLKSGSTCILLTTEKRLLERQLTSRKDRWTTEEKFEINMNNIIATVYRLRRH